jgi:hypothetical protein
VRPVGLFVAVMVLALASLAGIASAYTVAASASAAPAQTQVQVQTQFANSAEAVTIAVVPHQHDHGGSTGCCLLCCSATAPHILLQDTEVFLDRPPVRAFFVAAPAAVAKVVAGLPFRPPRTA